MKILAAISFGLAVAVSGLLLVLPTYSQGIIGLYTLVAVPPLAPVNIMFAEPRIPGLDDPAHPAYTRSYAAGERCAERCALSHRVIDAITEVCRVKNDYYLAKEKQPERVYALALGLKKARAAESAAVHALEEHTKQHGCRNKPGT